MLTLLVLCHTRDPHLKLVATQRRPLQRFLVASTGSLCSYLKPGHNVKNLLHSMLNNIVSFAFQSV